MRRRNREADKCTEVNDPSDAFRQIVLSVTTPRGGAEVQEDEPEGE